MIIIKNVKTKGGDLTEIRLSSPKEKTIDAQGKLISLPTFIDADNYFEVPLGTQNKTWETQAQGFLHAGITSVFAKGVNPEPEIVSEQRKQVDADLVRSQIPLSVYFFGEGKSPSTFDSIGKSKSYFKGITTSTDLLNVSKPPFKNALERIFQIAAQENLIVIIDLLKGRVETNEERKLALQTIKLGIELTEKYNGQLYLKHVRAQEEMALILAAKERHLLVFADVSYPHLFMHATNSPKDLEISPYFLPSIKDQTALWQALNQGYIDVVSSGCDEILTQDPMITVKKWLPSMLSAYQEKKLGLDTLVAVTRVNAENIFCLPQNDNSVLCDLNGSSVSEIGKLEGLSYIGRPVYMIVKGELLTIP